MDLTSEDLRRVEFRETWKGYNQADVDAFIDDVAAGVDALHAKLAELQTRATRAEAQPVVSSPDDDAVKRTLTLAQKAADLVVSEAKTIANRVVADANAQAARITGDAQASAEKQRIEQETESQRLVAQHVDAAERAHRVRVNELEAERSALEREVVQRRQELDQVVVQTQQAKDRLREALTDQLARLDAIGR